MESDLAGLYFAIFLVNFVSNKHNRNVVADSSEILVPFGHVFVGNSGGDVEHDDAGVSSDVVAFTKASKFFLTGSVPEGEFDGSMVSVESDGTNFNTLGSNVFFFELSGDVPLDESGLSNSSVSDEDDFELGNRFGRSLHLIIVTSIS